MKEVHATQNQDGTYYVTITNSSTKKKSIGKSEITETTDSHIRISRAEIQITAYPDDRNDGEMLKLEVKEDV